MDSLAETIFSTTAVQIRSALSDDPLINGALWAGLVGLSYETSGFAVQVS